jgi:threonine dehydrogenase-like Zn-dependent dehydrogenase
MYGAGDVRVIDVPDPVIQQPTDAIVRVVRACICGSDLRPYHSMPATAGGSSMGHEFIGVLEDTGDDVTSVKKGDLVIAPDGEDGGQVRVSAEAACEIVHKALPRKRGPACNDFACRGWPPPVQELSRCCRCRAARAG